MAYARVDFIVPGRPDTRMTWPAGMPPPRVSSRPSTNVGSFLISSVIHLHSRGAQGDATRDAELMERLDIVASRGDSEHLRQPEGPEACDLGAFLVHPRARLAVRTFHADLHSNRVPFLG